MDGYLVMKKIIVAVVVAILSAASVKSEEAQEIWHRQAFRAGVFGRAFMVCGDKAWMVRSEREMRKVKDAFDAFPNTLLGWMKEGVESFNDVVLKDGINAACRKLRSVQ